MLDFFSKNKNNNTNKIGDNLSLVGDKIGSQDVDKFSSEIEVKVMPQEFIGLRNVKVPTPDKGKINNENLSSLKGVASVGEIKKPGNRSLKMNIIIGIVLVVVLGGGMALAAFLFVRNVGYGENQIVEVNSNQGVGVENSDVSSKAEVVTENKGEVVETGLICVLCETSTCPFGCQLDVKGCWSTGLCMPAPSTDIENIEDELEDEIDKEIPSEDLDKNKEDKTNIDTENDVDTNKEIIFEEGEDGDKDNLTTQEELLYGTNKSVADTDGDGFGDGSEILNLYDPNFSSGALLKDSNRIRTFISNKFGYLVLIPVAWDQREISEGEQIRFTAPSDEFFTVIAEDNINSFTTARDWYESTFPGIDSGDLLNTTDATLDGIMSPDGLAAYFISTKHIYTVSYNPGLRIELNYLTTFKMILNSFSLFENPLE